ncbi:MULTISPECIES: sugar kinase [Flavobacterium]|uniref:Sugar kinase n=1 Tax=Flavobacterium hankyongi TaxID=1176532 RepID=A0ABP8ZNL9_9FLAO|nr:sugar kinase [Flavobacterium sp. N1846]
MSKVVTFGEIMLRLSTESNQRFSQAKTFSANYGGGEFNVAVSLANYGIEAEFVTRIPDNEIGHAALQEIRKMNVGMSNIQLGGDRLGIYFLETGVGNRGSNVVYDRSNSAIATIEENTFDWAKIFEKKDWFHWSGITPALSEKAAKECLKAIKTAHQLGLKISCDLNYRSKLWKYGKEPFEVMPQMLKYCNVILGDIDTAFFMLGIDKVNPDYENDEQLKKYYSNITDLCPNLETIATTLRYSINASHQKIGGVLFNNNKIYEAPITDVTNVVDRVGTGDAFMGGLLYSLIKTSDNLQRSIEFAVAACSLKHTIVGDYNLATLAEIEKIVNGDNSGKVSR